MENPDGRRYLEGDDLEPYKVPDSGQCWWCGGSADSREHKFKRTDLTRMRGVDDYLVWISEQQQVKVRSARKSPIVKFRPNMCTPCNNTRSQPFDAAYDKFGDYVWSHLGDLWERRFLDMQLIYGSDWQGSVLNLARYFAKQLACRMANAGYPVPSSIAPFLDGQPLLSNVHMVLFKDPGLWDIYRRGQREGFAASGLFLSPAEGAISQSRSKLVMYSSSAIIGYIGVMYRWDDDVVETDPFYVYRRARLHRRDHMPRV